VLFENLELFFLFVGVEAYLLTIFESLNLELLLIDDSKLMLLNKFLGLSNCFAGYTYFYGLSCLSILEFILLILSFQLILSSFKLLLSFYF